VGGKGWEGLKPPQSKFSGYVAESAWVKSTVSDQVIDYYVLLSQSRTITKQHSGFLHNPAK